MCVEAEDIAVRVCELNRKNVSILYHPVSIVFRGSCYAGAVGV